MEDHCPPCPPEGQAWVGSPPGLPGGQPGGEQDHCGRLTFSLQLTERFPEMLRGREGDGKQDLQGDQPGFFEFSCRVS